MKRSTILRATILGTIILAVRRIWANIHFFHGLRLHENRNDYGLRFTMLALVSFLWMFPIAKADDFKVILTDIYYGIADIEVISGQIEKGSEDNQYYFTINLTKQKAEQLVEISQKHVGRTFMITLNAYRLKGMEINFTKPPTTISIPLTQDFMRSKLVTKTDNGWKLADDGRWSLFFEIIEDIYSLTDKEVDTAQLYDDNQPSFMVKVPNQIEDKICEREVAIFYIGNLGVASLVVCNEKGIKFEKFID